MKLSVHEAILTVLWAGNCATTIQQVLTLKFVFGSEKFRCLSRNRPRPILEGFIIMESLEHKGAYISPPKCLATKHFFILFFMDILNNSIILRHHHFSTDGMILR